MKIIKFEKFNESDIENKEIDDIFYKLSDKFYEDGFLTKMYIKHEENTIFIIDFIRNDSKLTGTEVMTKIVNFADEYNLKIQLVASRKYGSDAKRLVSFYQKFGFEIIGTWGGEPEMRRVPIIF